MLNTRILVKIKKAWQLHKQRQRVTKLDISLFLRQFTTLLTAGVPLIHCCELLEKSQEKTAMRLLLYAIKRELLSGKSLFHSLRLHPLYFDEFTCQLIHVGEHTGQLDYILNRLADYREKNMRLQKQLHQALFYPCIISMTALLVCGCLFFCVIPRFAELFHGTHAKLPLLTTWIFTISAALRHYFILFLPLLAALGFLLSRHTHTLRQRLNQSAILQFFLRKMQLARFARNLAITFAAGIPIPQALKLSAPPQGELAKTVTQLSHKVHSGLQLHHAMSALPFFPLLMVQMVKVGEESGMLAEMLDKIALFYEADVDKLLTQGSQLLEPLIILILGALIGVIVIGMYLPIFKLGTTF
jgi:type IV pilus assembly protein PilC